MICTYDQVCKGDGDARNLSDVRGHNKNNHNHHQEAFFVLLGGRQEHVVGMRCRGVGGGDGDC
jgi:hypothetical protein